MTDELFCYDLGPNDCGGCGDLDQSEGVVGMACGEFSCGTAICNDEGTATVCEGDHERNVCGGCNEFLTGTPGETCSQCNSGTRTCTRDMDSMVCWRGRSPSNQCGGCDRCVLHHAFMDERLGGGYIRTGTTAVFEDVGTGGIQLSFDPLVEGPGANALELAHIYLVPDSPEPEFGGTCFSALDCGVGYDCAFDIGQCVKGAWVPSQFAAQLIEIGADPVRQYSLFGVDPGAYDYVVMYDWLLTEIISVGQILPGPPPDLPIEGPDAGPEPDAGPDAGAGDAGDGGDVGDGGVVGDGGDLDAGPLDAAGDAG
jgi:hypothetical protein